MTTSDPRVPVRPAEIGDVCVLLEPKDRHEIYLLHQRQNALQALFGGTLIENVHLTCQRLVCPEERLLPDLVGNLTRVLQDVCPIPLTALSLQMLHVPVMRTDILKWCIEVTADLRRFVRTVENAVAATGIDPLYPPRWVSSLVAALKDVPQIPPSSLSIRGTFPHHLFTIDKVELSRIDGPSQFTILATIHLCPPGPRPQEGSSTDL